MFPISQLTEKDLDMIQCRTNCRCSTDYLLRFWNKNKKSLFDLLDGQLIYSTHIEYSRSEDDMKNLIQTNLLDANKYEFWSDYRELFRAFNNCRCGNHPLIAKITNITELDNYDLRFYGELFEYLQYDIALNEVKLYDWYWDRLKEAPRLIMPNGKTLNIVKGMRAMRVLKQLADGFGLRGFEEFRIAHSQFHNDKTVNGTFCLSIHPLDFMTMSDNCEDWDSCMSWDNDGEYRQGTVEMMNSPYIICGYIQSDHNKYYIGHGNSWNSKRWRCLYLVHPEVIIAIRNYPWNNDEVSKFGLDILRDLAFKHGYGEYNDFTERFGTTGSSQIEYTHGVWHIPFRTRYMYNDLHNSLGYKTPVLHINEEISFSGEAECIYCGEEFSYYEDFAYSLECPSCASVAFCVECNSVIRSGDDCFTSPLGECLCSYCYEENYTACMDCNDTIDLRNENSYVNIYLTDKGKYINTPSDHAYCCFDCVKYNNDYTLNEDNNWCIDIRKVCAGDLSRYWGFGWWAAQEMLEKYQDEE